MLAEALVALRHTLETRSEELAVKGGIRDQVLARFQPLFVPHHLLELTADEFRSFLKFENNQHWSGLNRSASVLTADMDRLRNALGLLVDDGLPIAQRLNRLASGGDAYVRGFGKATQTAILLVVYPDRYGVWNGTSREGLRQLKLWPKFPRGAGVGERYEALNEIFLRLTAELGVDLWTLDWLWWSLHTEGNHRAYYKISPGPDGELWNECFDGGFIAMGWDEMGDLSALDRSAFEQVRHQQLIDNPGWTRQGLEQLWVFRGIAPGARIVANRGTREILGLGTVTKEYYYTESEPAFRHRLGVSWDETRPREVNQQGWRRALVTLSESTYKRLVAPDDDQKSSGFSEATVTLLQGLKDDPSRRYCSEHKEALKAHVQLPFQELFLEVGRRLPEVITEGLETEKRIFSRFVKNDYGRGGAWPFYWGAFFRADKKRTGNAQLFAKIAADDFVYGFSLGQATKRDTARFAENLRQVEGLLEEAGELTKFRFGAPEETSYEALDNKSVTRAQNWLETASRWPRAEQVEALDDWMRLGFSEQVSRIVTAFEAVYPLFLVAAEEDPVSAVSGYLGSTATEDPESPVGEMYTLEQLQEETSLDLDTLERWLSALNRKGQAILFGPPGTGKTYLAEKMARYLTEGTSGFSELVQFHPAFSYEDFVQGLRPKIVEGQPHFSVEPGVFVDFCRRARTVRPAPCVLIIDEINRANLSEVFGELMYLLEYRGRATTLAVGGTSFSIPKNVRVLGTMNTADRSIALVDHALRRRFSFLELRPNYELLELHQEHSRVEVDELIRVLQSINMAIGDTNFELGLSFFLVDDLEEHLEDIWKMEIEPYLSEYFFDQPNKVEPFRWERINSDVLT